MGAMGIGPSDAEVLYGPFLTRRVNGDGTPIDPLTVKWWYDLQPSGWGCDCGASEMECHSQTCAVTPLYASLVPPDFNMVIGSFHAINAGTTQTVIKCAQCGRERIGRDMDVIYQAPLYNDVGQVTGWQYKYPCNIVKAVCPKHNRKGRIGFQRQAWAGY